MSKWICDNFWGTKKISKKRDIVVHRNTLKETRNKKQKRDYVDKEEMMEFIINYYEEIDIKLKHHYLHCLCIEYARICKKIVNCKDFRRYGANFKEDLIQDAICRGLGVGVKGYRNYGIPYIMRFDYINNNNPLAFLTQMAKNFYIQYLNKHYQYSEIKKQHLIDIVDRFDIKNIMDGNKGVFFNYASVDGGKD